MKATPPEAKALTLADISVTWEQRYGECSMTRTITGRQLAKMITAAAGRTRTDFTLGPFQPDTSWIYKLQGLSALVFPDAGVSIHESEARAVLSDILLQAASELDAEAMDSEEWPTKFKVEMVKPDADGGAA
jgi:hypothetical protein